jgi:thiol:disulfide interchange protein
MLALKRVIGLVLGTIKAALPVRQTQDSQTFGNNNTVEHQRQRVTKGSRLKPSHAQADTQAQSRKTEISCAPTRTKKSSTLGTPQVTPAKQQSEPKRKSLVAQSITQGKLHSKGQSQLDKQVHGKQQAIPVFPILRPAKSKPKRKA